MRPRRFDQAIVFGAVMLLMIGSSGCAFTVDCLAGYDFVLGKRNPCKDWCDTQPAATSKSARFWWSVGCQPEHADECCVDPCDPCLECPPIDGSCCPDGSMIPWCEGEFITGASPPCCEGEFSSGPLPGDPTGPELMPEPGKEPPSTPKPMPLPFEQGSPSGAVVIPAGLTIERKANKSALTSPYHSKSLANEPVEYSSKTVPSEPEQDAEPTKRSPVKLEVMDVADPVPQGELAEYFIRVSNRGTEPVQLLRLTAECSHQLQPVKVSSFTQNVLVGRVLNLPPFVLEPGVTRTIRLRAKAIEQGTAKLEVSLRGKDVEGDLTSTESTSITTAGSAPPKVLTDKVQSASAETVTKVHVP